MQRIPFDDKPDFHVLTLYRISDKGRYLITKFTREPDDDWKESVYSSNVSCENCGYSYEIRVRTLRLKTDQIPKIS